MRLDLPGVCSSTPQIHPGISLHPANNMKNLNIQTGYSLMRFVTCVLLSVLGPSFLHSAERPNIVLILADDLSYRVTYLV